MRIWPAIVAIALFGSAAGAVAQEFCPQGPSATLESRSEIGGGFVYIQRMILERDGAGVQGRWFATSYEQTNLFPGSVPTATLPQTTGAIPGFGRCTTDAPNSQTIRTLCDRARAPFDVRGDAIFEPPNGRRVGRVIRSGGATTLSIDLLAGSGSPHPPMTGPVQDGTQAQFDLQLISVQRAFDGEAKIITLRIAPRRQPPGMTGLSARVVSDNPRYHPQIDVSGGGSSITARITLVGDATQVSRAAAATTLIAEVTTDGCGYEREWSLDGLMLALGAHP